VRRGTAGLSKWRALVAAVDEARAIRVSSSREYGARQEEELGREGGNETERKEREWMKAIGGRACVRQGRKVNCGSWAGARRNATFAR
jgi:hypothetical protein